MVKLHEFITAFKTAFWCVLDAGAAYLEEGAAALRESTTRKIKDF